MRIRIEITDGNTEDEITIRCGAVDDNVRKIQAYIASLSAQRVTYFKDGQEFFIPPEDVLFFETEDEQVFAHTADDSFRVRRKLYELEEVLPRFFVRAAKGMIVNTNRIYAITRNIASASLVKFNGTNKTVYVSRHYYKALKDKMTEKGR
jgi:DNA-binding LytR/AlgR family response regulator